MASHNQGKGRVNISVHSRTEVASYIDERADRLEWTRSKFAKQIMDWWIAMGAPNVHQAEETHPPIPVPQSVLATVDLTRIPLRDTHHPWSERANEAHAVRHKSGTE